MERLGRFFFIRKSYFLQVKNIFLVGTLGKICVFRSLLFQPNLWIVLSIAKETKASRFYWRSTGSYLIFIILSILRLEFWLRAFTGFWRCANFSHGFFYFQSSDQNADSLFQLCCSFLF
ncbi:hypothetical protein LBK6_05210 [Leptospira borgpetersenii serovar Hardjo]|nr:hypothetical protein LBK6_05210 [Leptospira borgpetersenii serovar Hardjo]AMX61003.1 hypothetical protein LBK9_05145 [Leptospira borgpetersenii serovar Hardjo]AMX64246.1 hypothetical protein LBK30_05175 [Leptospira borgpetersenii serovar Hardjo]AMX67487.1 hypothetical protein LBHA_05160 [Leptospira borgpetersenii serovar Hardjo]AMX71779.1 hypothetical protein LBHB_11065 [Leptospira borgpetersenii serovar Hardjo]